MSSAQPVSNLSPYFVEFASLTTPVSWLSLFGNDHPVEFEVGPGKGLFLANAATRAPGVNFCGVELARKYARKAADRVAKRKLENVRVIAGDARRFLAQFVPPGGLRAVHVYFPDPWWKKRHKKRRVFQEALVRDARRGLTPGGELWIATDVEEYFEVMKALMAEHSEFQPAPVPETVAPVHDLDYLTNFERKYRIEGRPVFRSHYQLDPCWVEPARDHPDPDEGPL